jgi:hypothetical protein
MHAFPNLYIQRINSSLLNTDEDTNQLTMAFRTHKNITKASYLISISARAGDEECV